MDLNRISRRFFRNCIDIQWPDIRRNLRVADKAVAENARALSIFREKVDVVSILCSTILYKRTWRTVGIKRPADLHSVERAINRPFVLKLENNNKSEVKVIRRVLQVIAKLLISIHLNDN